MTLSAVQKLEWYDFFGAPIAFLIFFGVVAVFCSTFILWCYIRPGEETVYPEKWRKLGCCAKCLHGDQPREKNANP